MEGKGELANKRFLSGRAQLTAFVHSGGCLQGSWILFGRGQLPRAGAGKVDYPVDLRLWFCWSPVLEG